MIDLFFVFLTIIILFFILLGLKSAIKKEFCAICLAISITWITLFTLNKAGLFEDKLLIGIMMGQTILGLFYLAEKKTSEEIKLFRLPLLLSMIFAGYSAISNTLNIPTIKLLTTVWTIFTALFLYRQNNTIKKAIDKIVACCKWG